MWIDQQQSDRLWPWGIALLRIVVGLAFFMHGYQKLFQMGVGNVAGFFGSIGLPAPELAAWVVSLVETFGGLALILGLGVRIAGVLLAVDMLVALLVFHRPNGFFVSDGGIELVLVLGSAALALAMTGPGALALDSILPFGKESQSGSRTRVASTRS
ncbi:MAG: DoxX family protein [Thermomicrobiales bacterium]